MSSSPELERIKTSIEASYPVGTVHNLTLLHYPALRPQTPDRMSLNYRVDTSLGVFCLKSHPAKKPQKRIDFERKFHQALNHADPGVAPELVAASTELNLDERTWWMERFIEAPHYSWWLPTWNVQECRAAGKMLARFHDAVVPLLDVPDPAAPDTTGSARSVVGSPVDFSSCYPSLAVIAAAEQRGIDSTFEREWVVARARLELAISQGEQEFGFGSTPIDKRFLRHVHGDYHPGNTLFVSGSVQGIVDFEHVHVDHLVFDIAYALIMFATNWDGTDETEPFHKGFSRSFLEGYLSHESAQMDTQAVPRYVSLAAILIGGWLLEMAGNATENADVIFHRFMRLMNSWRYLME